MSLLSLYPYMFSLLLRQSDQSSRFCGGNKSRQHFKPPHLPCQFHGAPNQPPTERERVTSLCIVVWIVRALVYFLSDVLLYRMRQKRYACLRSRVHQQTVLYLCMIQNKSWKAATPSPSLTAIQPLHWTLLHYKDRMNTSISAFSLFPVWLVVFCFTLRRSVFKSFLSAHSRQLILQLLCSV